jgi:DNA replication protein DnaC
MNKSTTIKEYCRTLNLGNIASNLDQVILDAEKKQYSYLDYTVSLFQAEVAHRQQRDINNRIKAARLPLCYDLSAYDSNVSNGLDKKQLNQLRELKWLEQNYNILLMGPSGTGKTFIAAGLCYDAIMAGYRAYFKSLDNLIHLLKMKEVTRTAAVEVRRLYRAHLIVIDDIMLLPVTKNDAVALFNFINNLYEKTSFIITTNKSPKEWAQMLDDEVLATALLDRLLFKCEIIKLEGNSYRMKNRKTIFAKSD